MKLNKKGYMLVEIVLASVIAFGIAYFMLDLTIKLKNKNDDLVVETQVVTDKTIIANGIMKTIIENDDFSCDKISISGNVIKYDGTTIDVLNEYASFGTIEKTCTTGNISILIPLQVSQMPDRNFDIKINYER